jgi:hypothetical protein
MLAHTAQYGRNRAVPAPLTFYAPPSFNILNRLGHNVEVRVSEEEHEPEATCTTVVA